MTPLTISYRIALLCFVAQFVLLGVGTFTREDMAINSAYSLAIALLWTLIKGLPWLVLIPGLIAKTEKIMAWMSYVCLIYFIIWVLAAFGENPLGLGTWGIWLTLLQFCAAAYYTRLQKRQA